MWVFFDTSAFVKRYVQEPGSEKVQDICVKATVLILSIICLPEVISTLSRLKGEGKISIETYNHTKRLLFDDFEDVEICNLTPEVLEQTIRCLETNRLSVMDAIHLASAITVGCDLFVSSDIRQIEAVKNLGLEVEQV
jgi:predicted nucleic acid-binding protein